MSKTWRWRGEVARFWAATTRAAAPGWLPGAFLLAWLAGGPARAQDSPATSLEPSAASLTQAAVAAGDEQYGNRDFEAALKTYEAAIAADSTSCDLWWRAARSLTDRGQRAEYDKNPKAAEAAYAEAVRAARRATELAPSDWQGHLALAVAVGRLALFRGGREKIRLSKEVKTEADRTLALNPHSDRAHHVLGRWNREISSLSFVLKAAAKVVYGGVPKGASPDSALAHFDKAIEINPNYINHRLELGVTYLDMGRKDEARAQFETVLQLPVVGAFDAEYKEEAARLLRKMGK